MKRLQLWCEISHAEIECDALESPLAIAGAGGAAVVLAPALEAGAAALLLGDAALEARLNGRALAPGLHLMRPRDRLEVGGRTCWLGVELRADETVFDPERHGKDVFCCRTKARLQPGDAIAICPGSESKDCGAIYKLSAWQAGGPCHVCRFDPKAPSWRPSAASARRSLDSLLQLAAARGGGRDGAGR
jgi:hypothetical protein